MACTQLAQLRVWVCGFVQLKAWEEYTSKLEEKYVALMTEHEAFQRELAAVRGILDDGSDAQIHGTFCLIPSLFLLPMHAHAW